MLDIAYMRLLFDRVTTPSRPAKSSMDAGIGRIITPGARRGYVTGTMATLDWDFHDLDSSAAAARLNNLLADERATVTGLGSLLFVRFFSLASTDRAEPVCTLAATE